MDSNSWSALGSVLGGIFTGLAFFATLFLVMREARIRREDQDDEQARQARLIVSRITDESYPLNNPRTLELEGTIWNYSDKPVFNLVVTLEDVGTGREGFRMLTPGGSIQTKLLVRWKDDGKPMDMGLPRQAGLNLHFLDANGRHWHRKGTNQPIRVRGNALSERVPAERFKPEEL